ncbi:MAG: hypothetical protein JXP73_02700 [Deltaproteobacteria bacterium]|nr:hypothetical protein [Deltaproteobacteria bacterium]
MSRTTTNHALQAVLLLGVAGAAACAEVEAEVPEAQVTQKGVSFHGVGIWSGWPGEVSAMQSFTLSSTNLSWVKDLNAKVYITQIDLKAGSGVEDLSFIHHAHVTMADAEKKWSAVPVVDYARPEKQGPTPVLSAKTPYPVDISRIWTADEVMVSIAVAGDLPKKGWSVDVVLHLSGKLSYKL